MRPVSVDNERGGECRECRCSTAERCDYSHLKESPHMTMTSWPHDPSPGICTDRRPDTELPSLWESLALLVKWAPALQHWVVRTVAHISDVWTAKCRIRVIDNVICVHFSRYIDNNVTPSTSIQNTHKLKFKLLEKLSLTNGSSKVKVIFYWQSENESHALNIDAYRRTPAAAPRTTCTAAPPRPPARSRSLPPPRPAWSCIYVKMRIMRKMHNPED